MICPHCQQSIPDDSRFCPFCGEAVNKQPAQKAVEEQKPKKKNGPRSRKKILLFSVLGVIVALLGVYFGTYFAVRNKAQAGEFSTARKLLLVPAVTRLHDPQLVSYIYAGLLYEQEDYKGAEKAFGSLAENNYLDAVEMKNYSTCIYGLERIENKDITGYYAIEALAKQGFPAAVETLPDVKDLVYEKGIELYRKKDFVAENYFKAINPYRRSYDYLTLLNTRPNYNALIRLLGFEDANKILLNKHPETFLKGTWMTSDGRYSFSIKENSKGGYTSNYTLPSEASNFPYYSFNDGLYYLTNDKNERKNVFQFSIFDADIITVYCYKDSKTYWLYRK